MDTNIQIVEALANGVNPLTGEVLPNESLYNNPEIIRALFTTLSLLKKPPKIKKTVEQKQNDNIENGLPRNAGLPWTQEQKSELASQYKAGIKTPELAKSFERTYGAITAELKKQGLIEV